MTPANTVLTSGGQVTINGDQFLDNSDSDWTLEVFGMDITVCSEITNQRLICTIPALTTDPVPAGRVIYFQNIYLESTTYAFNFAAPTVTSASISSGGTIGTDDITIYGTSFGLPTAAVAKVMFDVEMEMGGGGWRWRWGLWDGDGDGNGDCVIAVRWRRGLRDGDGDGGTDTFVVFRLVE